MTLDSRLLRRSAAVAAGATLACGAIAHGPTAGAATNCTPISGVGSTFQLNAQNGFIAGYGCPTPGPSYSGGGSGAGINSQIARTAQWGGTDIPYSEQQWAQIQSGAGTAPGVSGTPSTVETIPVALGAVVVPYNPPTSTCAPSPLRLSSPVLAGIYSGQITSWADPSITSLNPGISCTGTVIPSARAEASGTTFAFKDYLSKRNPVFNVYKQSQFNTQWPDPVAPGTDPNPIGCRGTGNNGVLNCVASTPGAIGYADYSDFAKYNNTHLPQLSGATVDSSDGAFYGYTLGGCTKAAQGATTPPSTELDWAHVSLTDTAGAYPICTFTYDLVLTHPVTAGSASSSQGPALGAYFGYVTSASGQSTLPGNNYDALPETVRAVAANGAAAIGTTLP